MTYNSVVPSAYLLVLTVQALDDAQITQGDLHSVEVVGGSSRVPALLRIIKEFFDKEPGRTLNAKECVSRGAALNCAMLSPIFRSGTLLVQTCGTVCATQGQSCVHLSTSISCHDWLVIWWIAPTSLCSHAGFVTLR